MGYTIVTNKNWERMSDAEGMQLWRKIADNNQGVYPHFGIATTEKFLPHVLVYLGLFVSTSQVKKNRPDLWKDVEDAGVVKVGKITLKIWTTDHIIEIDRGVTEPWGKRFFRVHKQVWAAIHKLGLK